MLATNLSPSFAPLGIPACEVPSSPYPPEPSPIEKLLALANQAGDLRRRMDRAACGGAALTSLESAWCELCDKMRALAGPHPRVVTWWHRHGEILSQRITPRSRAEATASREVGIKLMMSAGIR